MGRYKNITILHSNDLHGDFLAEDIDNKLVGGVSRLSGYINKVRSEEKNVLYCIAGDMFRGSVIDSDYQGLSTIEIMNMISPDVVTIGNHETDYGLSHLLFLEKCAKFPIINANLFIKTNRAHLFSPYKIIEIDGMRILFIGIVTEQVLSNAKNEGLIGTFVDVEEASREVGRICNTYNAIDIDYTILLTHIGWEEDHKLAELLDPAWGVDVIIGGHSHTFIDKPDIVNDVLIVQAGTGTDIIGRFDITIDTQKNCTKSWKWQSVPINDKNCPKDEKIEEIISKYKSETDTKYGRVITRLNRELTHPERTRETQIGDLFADIFKENLGVDIMLLGSGSIRNPHLGPIVMLQDLIEIFPYDDALYMIKVTGKQLKSMVKHFLRDEAFDGDHTEFYQISDGLEIEYTIPTHKFEKFLYNGQEIDNKRIFSVALQAYHYKNMEDSFNITLDEVEENGKSKIIATSCRDIIEEYLSTHQHLDRSGKGRLIINKKKEE